MKKIYILIIAVFAIQTFGLDIKAATDADMLKDIIKDTVEHLKKNDGSIVIESKTKETYYSAVPDTSKLDSKILGKRAVVQANMSNMRASAELYYSANNNYGPATNSCTKSLFTDQLMSKSVEEIKKQGVIQISCLVTSKNPSWMVTARLPGGNFWCADSQGASQYVSRGYKNGDKRCDMIPALKSTKITETAKNTINLFPKDYSFIIKLEGSSEQSNGMYISSNGYVYLTIPELEKYKPELKGSLMKINEPAVSLYKPFDFEKDFGVILQSNDFTVTKKTDKLYQASISYENYINLFRKSMAIAIPANSRKKLVFDIYVQNNLITKIVSRNISISAMPSSSKFSQKTSEVFDYSIVINRSSDKFPSEKMLSNKILSCEEYFSGTDYTSLCSTLK